ncbi:type II toxin-antitoxin system VapC family toxin [Vulgatibacter sp.]|uniref:type II toxin-antitoxin system VapC family toxin n=1 Tax=Vulgatibacter sp. TaxID=1971226 RepID=UPI00356B4F47
MILLDTHALFWWAVEPEKLSPQAASVCEQMEREGGFASAISIWELGVKARSGKLLLGTSLENFVRRLEVGGVVQLLPVDTSIWLRTAMLEWDHRDPADRVIVATAMEHGIPLLSKDTALHSFEGVTCVW